MKISNEVSIYHDIEEDLLFLYASTTEVPLQRMEAIKLRNYLNDYINGNLEEQE